MPPREVSAAVLRHGCLCRFFFVCLIGAGVLVLLPSCTSSPRLSSPFLYISLTLICLSLNRSQIFACGNRLASPCSSPSTSSSAIQWCSSSCSSCGSCLQRYVHSPPTHACGRLMPRSTTWCLSRSGHHRQRAQTISSDEGSGTRTRSGSCSWACARASVPCVVRGRGALGKGHVQTAGTCARSTTHNDTRALVSCFLWLAPRLIVLVACSIAHLGVVALAGTSAGLLPSPVPTLSRQRVMAASAAMVPPMDDDQLQAVYTWLDSVPLSRPKRNCTRDFSDGGETHCQEQRYLPQDELAWPDRSCWLARALVVCAPRAGSERGVAPPAKQTLRLMCDAP